MRPEIKMAGMAVGIGILMSFEPGTSSSPAETQPAIISVEVAAGAIATTETTVLESVTVTPTPAETITPPETLAAPIPEEETDTEDEYVEEEVVPALEAAGVEVLEPKEETVEEVNGPGQLIISAEELAGEFGTQFTIVDVTKQDTDTEQQDLTMSVSVAAVGELEALLDSETYNENIYGTDDEDEAKPLKHIDSNFCDYKFDPERPQDAVRFMRRANRVVTRAFAKNTIIDMSSIMAGLPAEGFECELGTAISEE